MYIDTGDDRYTMLTQKIFGTEQSRLWLPCSMPKHHIGMVYIIIHICEFHSALVARTKSLTRKLVFDWNKIFGVKHWYLWYSFYRNISVHAVVIVRGKWYNFFKILQRLFQELNVCWSVTRRSWLLHMDFPVTKWGIFMHDIWHLYFQTPMVVV